jgi:transcription initiation factor TFIIH subunit 4
MVMGVITRDSIHEALKSGITAEQILTFLRTHAHPQMLAKLPIIPSTVVDQIKLWEMERDRLQFTDGVLYSQFMSLSDYELLKKYAEVNLVSDCGCSQTNCVFVSFMETGAGSTSVEQ